jgi:hypothetical protein
VSPGLVSALPAPTSTLSAAEAAASGTAGTPQFAGYLDPPEVVNSDYGVDASGGPLQASVQFVGGPTLTLSLSCDGAKISQSVVPNQVMALPSASGSCTVSVTAPAGVPGPFSYVIHVGA